MSSKRNDESGRGDEPRNQDHGSESSSTNIANEKERPEKRPRGQDESDAAAANKKKKHVRKKDLSAQVLDMRRRIQQCCASNDLATAMEAYDEALANNVMIEAQSFYNLLNLCDGFGDRGVHIGTPKQPKTSIPVEIIRNVDPETRQSHAFRIKRHMEDLKLALNETAYTALVRLLSKARMMQEAERLLAEAEGVSQCRPKLRLYSSLLAAYCEMGQMRSALVIWARLAKLDLVLTEKEYSALIQCATQTGDAIVMERVLSDLAEDVLVPSHDTTRSISDWFSSPHAVLKDDDDSKTSGSDDTGMIHSVQLPSSNAPSMGPVQCKVGWVASNACKVDVNTGVLATGCLEGEALQPVTLSPATWKEMMDMNETIVRNGTLDNDTSLYQGGGKGPKRQPSKQKGGVEKRLRSWKVFQDYLDKRGQKFDVVIDGANVGYYKTNFANAPKHVDYKQIDWVISHFRERGQSVLLVLHERHFFPKLMPDWAVPIAQSWNDVLYRTPSGMNDDWFWLHAALWSGMETLVLTNDEMRDHHFQMLAPRSFVRWKERHQVHFYFGEWDNGRRTLELMYPERYSRRIQRVANGLVVPLAKRGDEHRYLDGTHVAQDDPEEETYLCIRPKQTTSNT